MVFLGFLSVWLFNVLVSSLKEPGRVVSVDKEKYKIKGHRHLERTNGVECVSLLNKCQCTQMPWFVSFIYLIFDNG